MIQDALHARNMGAILQTILKAFSWMKMYEFGINFTEVCSQKSNWQYSSIGSDNDLAPTRWHAIMLTNDGLVYLLIYVSVILNELTEEFQSS